MVTKYACQTQIEATPTNKTSQKPEQKHTPCELIIIIYLLTEKLAHDEGREK